MNSLESHTWYIVYRDRVNYNKLEATLREKNVTYFLPKLFEEVYDKEAGRMVSKEVPAVKNYVFIYTSESIREMTTRISGLKCPLIDCSTKKPAIIPDSQMQTFQNILSKQPKKMDFLKHPYSQYAANKKVRVKAGPYEGLSGYLVRIKGDRKLVLQLGGQAVSITGIHVSLLEVIE